MPKQSKIDWGAVDWNLRNSEIAELLGVTLPTVGRHRRRLNKGHICPTCGLVVDPEMYHEKWNRKKECRACGCGWHKRPHSSPWTDSMLAGAEMPS